MFDPVVAAHDLLDMLDRLPSTPENERAIETWLAAMPRMQPATAAGADMLLTFGHGLGGFARSARTDAAFAAGVSPIAAMLAGAVPYDATAVAAWATSVAEAVDLDALDCPSLSGELAAKLSAAEGVATFMIRR